MAVAPCTTTTQTCQFHFAGLIGLPAPNDWEVPPDQTIPLVLSNLVYETLCSTYRCLQRIIVPFAPTTPPSVPANLSYTAFPADDLHSYFLEHDTGITQFLSAITSAHVEMPNCFGELILPSTLQETNIDLNFDTMPAAVSPVHHHDLTFSSSTHSHSPSLSSSSVYSISHEVNFDLEMAYQGDEEAARRLLFPSPNQTYYPQSSAVQPQQTLYTGQQTSLPSDNQSWMSLPIFSQQQNTYTDTLPPNGIYPAYDTNPFTAGGGVIPPTPQATETPSFFNVLPSQPQQNYLITNSSHAPSYSSHESNSTSNPSLSRSCSPAQLTYPASVNTFPSSTAAPNYTTHLISTAQPIHPSQSQSQIQLSQSYNSNSLHSCGILVPPTSPSAPQAWRCAYPNCSSRALFTRGCDLRKHYNRHSKHLFCRVKGCPQSEPRVSESVGSSSNPGRPGGTGNVVLGGGFSSKKDRARHEAKHNPRILCEWVGENGERCGRRFSRVDNMKDHVRRIHRKGQEQRQGRSGQSGPDFQQELGGSGQAGRRRKRVEEALEEEEEDDDLDEETVAAMSMSPLQTKTRRQ